MFSSENCNFLLPSKSHYIICVFVFVCFFTVPVNNFSVILGRSHSFLGINQFFGNLKAIILYKPVFCINGMSRIMVLFLSHYSRQIPIVFSGCLVLSNFLYKKTFWCLICLIKRGVMLSNEEMLAVIESIFYSQHQRKQVGVLSHGKPFNVAGISLSSIK